MDFIDIVIGDASGSGEGNEGGGLGKGGDEGGQTTPGGIADRRGDDRGSGYRAESRTLAEKIIDRAGKKGLLFDRGLLELGDGSSEPKRSDEPQGRYGLNVRVDGIPGNGERLGKSLPSDSGSLRSHVRYVFTDMATGIIEGALIDSTLGVFVGAVGGSLIAPGPGGLVGGAVGWSIGLTSGAAKGMYSGVAQGCLAGCHGFNLDSKTSPSSGERMGMPSVDMSKGWRFIESIFIEEAH